MEFRRVLFRSLLDEPFNGINPALIEVLIAMVRKHNADGKTFLLISHEMPHVSELCGTVSVLAAGTNVTRGTPAEVRQNTAVSDAYLGHGRMALDSRRGVAGYTREVQSTKGIVVRPTDGKVTRLRGPTGHKNNTP